jgi:hypothetical protein
MARKGKVPSVGRFRTSARRGAHANHYLFADAMRDGNFGVSQIHGGAE